MVIFHSYLSLPEGIHKHMDFFMEFDGILCIEYMEAGIYWNMISYIYLSIYLSTHLIYLSIYLSI